MRATIGLTAVLWAATTVAQSPTSETSESWPTEIFEATRGSVVRVDTLHGGGGGFVFHDRRHVATAYHVIQEGRRVRVRTLQGDRWIPVRIVAIDRDRDLAVLRADEDLAEPLALAPPPAVGERIAVIGHPWSVLEDDTPSFEGLFTWSMTTGRVNAVGPSGLQIDAAVGPGSSGGPVLDPSGRVVGVVSRGEDISVAARADALGPLLEEVGTQPIYTGRWRPSLELEADLMLENGQSFGGLHVGLGVVGYDRFGLIGRFGMLARADDVSDEPFFQRGTVRLTFGLEAQYRHGFRAGDVPMHLVFGVGFWGAHEIASEERLEISIPNGCDPSVDRCPVDTFTARDERRRWLARPSLRVALNIGQMASLSYGVQIDVREPRNTSHIIGFGLAY